MLNNKDSIVLSKSSTGEDLKRYFTAVLELSKSDNKFPINLDEVWPLVYNRCDKAISTLRKNFFEGEDFVCIEIQSLPQMVERVWGGQNKVSYFLTLSCLEYYKSFSKKVLSYSSLLLPLPLRNIHKGGTEEPQTDRWRVFYT